MAITGIGTQRKSLEKLLQEELTERREKLARKLKTARKEAKVTQLVAGFIVGKDQPFISRVEKTGEIDAITLCRLAALYDKPLAYFITEIDYPYKDRPLSDWEHRAKFGRWPRVYTGNKRIKRGRRWVDYETHIALES